ncbi:MAG: asparagine synthase, partial [Bacteroidales bacterium]|nr:asparagine synthase [Bacteroidales bacterium]
LRDLLHKIIADHTRGITKLGIPLSGGLDSGTIACIAARTMNNINKEIISVSSVLDQKFNHNDVADEMDFIQEILTHEKGIIPRYLYHTDQDFHKDLEIKFKRQFSVINSNHYIDDGIFRHLKSCGVRRMLTGVYGDFTATNRLINPYPRLLLTGRLFALIKLIESDRIHSGLSLYSIVKSNIVLPLLPFVLREILFRLKHTPIKWGSEELGLIPDEKERKEVQNRLMSDFRKHFLSDLNILHNIWPAYHEPFYEEWDCESAHYGIEITYPMADRRLIEFLLSLPVEHFMADGMKRGLIRKSMEGILPEKIRLRKGKITYSPGYHDILTKDKSKYLDTLNNISRESPLNMYVNLAYLSKRLESLLNRKNSIIFEGNYWNLINTYLWVSFCKAIDEGQFHNN